VESNHVNVIGKIDLSAINQRTRPDKRKEEPAQKAKPAQSQAPVNTPKPEEKPKAPVDEPKVEEKTVAPEIETIRFERQVLSGPTVLGKIELPVERPRNPVNALKRWKHQRQIQLQARIITDQETITALVEIIQQTQVKVRERINQKFLQRIFKKKSRIR
jgi:hypothetical protein